MNTRMVYNSRITQGIHYLSFIIFTVLVIAIIYWAVKIYREDDTRLSLVVLLIPLTFFGCRIYMNSLLLKYLPARFTYTETNCIVTLRGNSTQYLWSEVSKVSIIRSSLSELLLLYNAEGTCIYAANRKTNKAYRYLEDFIMSEKKVSNVSKVYLIF